MPTILRKLPFYNRFTTVDVNGHRLRFPIARGPSFFRIVAQDRALLP
jgi:hypothetical protein